MKDYYRVLEIKRDCSKEEVRQAYRRLIKKYHPDLNPSKEAATRARLLNDGYDILYNEETRRRYDDELARVEAGYGGSTRKRTRQTRESPREAEIKCENCGVADSTLRVCVMYRVHSFLVYSRKSPKVQILCDNCRKKAAAEANTSNLATGWWSVAGFLWNLEALFTNDAGGEQPVENNAALLRAVGVQLYNKGDYEEAYKAFSNSYLLKPLNEVKEILDFLRQKVKVSAERDDPSEFGGIAHQTHINPTIIIGVSVCICLIFLLMNSFFVTRAPLKVTSGATDYRPHVDNVSHLNNEIKAVPPKPVFNEPEQELPSEDILQQNALFSETHATDGPLQIITDSAKGNYVVKIEDALTGETCGLYFVKAGRSLDTSIPLGSYKLKFASGETWYGVKHLFGPQTRYSYIEQPINIQIQGNYVTGHTIRLIPQLHGNLETPSMSANKW